MPTKGLVDLLPQTPDIDLDDIGIAVEIVGPNPVKDRHLRDHEPGATDEVLEYRELACGTPDFRTAAQTAVPGRVKAQVAHLDRRWNTYGSPAKQGTEMGNEHRKGERLGQVVVGAGVECPGFVELAVLCCQYQNRGPVAMVAQLLADLEPTAPGKHQVQDERVVVVLGGPPQPVASVEGDLDREALVVQSPFHDRCDLAVVLDQQDLHSRPSLSRRDATTSPMSALCGRRGSRAGA